MYWLFPFHKVPAGSRIVLYSGSTATKNYLQQIWETNYCKLVAIVSKHAETTNIRNINIFSYNKLIELDYDYVLITPINKDIRSEIKAELLSLGVPKSKIVLCDLEAINWDYPDVECRNQYDEYESHQKIDNYFEEIVPRLLLNSKRIDIATKYLLFYAWANGLDDTNYLSLYSRTIYGLTNGKEGGSYWSVRDAKETVDDYIEQGKELLLSILSYGFDPHYYIPLDEKGKPCAGLHRISAAIVCREKVWVRKYDRLNTFVSIRDLKWFETNGFSLEDRILILRTFLNIYLGKLGIFVMQESSAGVWSYVEKKISSVFTVVGAITLKYSPAFEAHDVRIIAVSDEDLTGKDFYQEISYTGRRIREHFFINLQYSESENEFIYMKEKFLPGEGFLHGDYSL